MTPKPISRTRKTKENLAKEHVMALYGYDHIYHPQAAYRFALLGCDDKRIAELLDIPRIQFDRWVKFLPDFTKALREGKEDADAKVVDALFRRACGYTFEEEVYERQAQYETIYNEDGEDTGQKEFLGWEMVKVKHTKKEIPPDVSAASLFLTNRTRNRAINERWSNRQEITGADGSPLMATEEMDKRASAARAALLAQVNNK